MKIKISEIIHHLFIYILLLVFEICKEKCLNTFLSMQQIIKQIIIIMNLNSFYYAFVGST